MSDEKKKNLFMKNIKRIVEANKTTIEILRSNKMMNLRTMERASKCTKDPNPLSTAMSLMGTKYPLSIDKTLAKKFKVPSVFIPNDKNTQKDRHKHSRVLCKKEAINWWLFNSELPSKNSIDVINILSKQTREEVKNYYLYDWSKARIKWGTPIVERKYVATRAPTVEIPQELREAAIKEALFPEFTIPNPSLSDATIERVKDLITLEMDSKLILSKQIRILINEMDPRVRCLPIIPDSDAELVTVKHAICHTNYVITNYKMVERREPLGFDRKLEAVAKALIMVGRERNLNSEAIKEIANDVTISEQRIFDLLNMGTKTETIFIKWIKSIYRFPVTFESRIGEILVSPVLSNTRYIMIGNTKKKYTPVPSTLETVNFKRGANRGKFVHCRGALTELVVNFTSYRDLIETLVDIAKYIRYGYTTTTGTNVAKTNAEIAKKVRDNPRALIQAGRGDMNKIGDYKGVDMHVGIMKLSEGTEYISGGKIQLDIDEEMNLINRRTNQKIEMTIDRKEMNYFPMDIRCSNLALEDFMCMKDAIKSRMSYYIDNIKYLKSMIKKRNFQWYNKIITKFIGREINSLSNTCRSMCCQMVEKNSEGTTMLAILYCFSYKDPIITAPCGTYFQLKENMVLDISGKSGILQYDEDKRCYMLFGTPVEDESTRLDRAKLFTGLLTGYRIVDVTSDTSYPKRSIKYLEDNKDKIQEGNIFSTYIYGDMFNVIKDSSINAQISLTYQRQLDEVRLSLSQQTQSLLFGKHFLISDEDLEEAGPSKKPHVESQEENLSLSDNDSETQDFALSDFED